MVGGLALDRSRRRSAVALGGTTPRRATILLAAFVAGCGFLAGARTRVPAGWRLPTAAETAQAWRDDRDHRYLRVRADFTGDGLVDEAAFLVETPEERLVLVLLEARRETTTPVMHLIDDLGDVALLEGAGIDLASPGVHRVVCEDASPTACPDADGKRALELRTPGIDYFEPDSARRLLYWNPAERQLDQAWTSD